MVLSLELETLMYGNEKTSCGNCGAILAFKCCDGNAVFSLKCHVYEKVEIFILN